MASWRDALMGLGMRGVAGSVRGASDPRGTNKDLWEKSKRLYDPAMRPPAPAPVPVPVQGPQVAFNDVDWQSIMEADKQRILQQPMNLDPVYPPGLSREPPPEMTLEPIVPEDLRPPRPPRRRRWPDEPPPEQWWPQMPLEPRPPRPTQAPRRRGRRG